MCGAITLQGPHQVAIYWGGGRLVLLLVDMSERGGGEGGGWGVGAVGGKVEEMSEGKGKGIIKNGGWSVGDVDSKDVRNRGPSSGFRRGRYRILLCYSRERGQLPTRKRNWRE